MPLKVSKQFAKLQKACMKEQEIQILWKKLQKLPDQNKTQQYLYISEERMDIRIGNSHIVHQHTKGCGTSQYGRGNSIDFTSKYVNILDGFLMRMFSFYSSSLSTVIYVQNFGLVRVKAQKSLYNSYFQLPAIGQLQEPPISFLLLLFFSSSLLLFLSSFTPMGSVG